LDNELAEAISDFVRSFARCVFRRLDLLSSFAAQYSDEAPARVRLPARRLHDLRESASFRALHHRNESAFLLARSTLAFVAAFLPRPAFFAGLAFFPALRGCFVGPAMGSGLLMLSLLVACLLIDFLLDRAAVVTLINPVGRRCKHNLQAIVLMRRMPHGVKAICRDGGLFYIPDKTKRATA
jgi:hypothetical protein